MHRGSSPRSSETSGNRRGRASNRRDDELLRVRGRLSPDAGRRQRRVNPERFRSLFPALQKAVWLDTPASPPGAQPIVDALTSALERWLSGTFRWSEWEAEATASRELFANYLGVPRSTVALMSSFAEAAATVAACLPPGRIVVGDEEYRDHLFPWVALRDVGREVVRVQSAAGAVRTEDLIAAIRPGTALVAVSEVLSSDGARADLPSLRAASDEVGARLFVDVTQSLGVLRFAFQQVLPDYLAVHGYKWLLSPRGAACLVAREDRVDELRPLLPSWKSTPEAAFFGGELQYAPTAARCDTPTAWFSWIGARAALTLASELPREEVERHCLELAARFRDGCLRCRRRADGWRRSQPYRRCSCARRSRCHALV